MINTEPLENPLAPAIPAAHAASHAALGSDPVTLEQSQITDLVSALAGKEATANKSTSVTADGSSDTKFPSVKAAKDYIDSLVVGLLDDRGSYDASGNVFPSSGGSGSAGAILKGDIWYISVGGSLGGTAALVGSSVRALANTPGQTAGNWDILNVGIGFVPENVANKDTDSTFAANSDTNYPSQKAVKTALATKAPTSRTLTAAGLATGGGDLSANRTITVPVASQAEAEAGTATDKAMTPERTAQAIAALGGGGGSSATIPINTQTGTSYTLAASDAGGLTTMDNVSANAVTVPLNATVPIANESVFALAQIGDGLTSVVGEGGVTLISLGNNLDLAGKGASAALVKIGTNTWLLILGVAGSGGGGGGISVPDGTYKVGLGGITDGELVISGGALTDINEAS